ncbi:MAG TPA: hypothetical protein VM369_05180 [Candidatus Binatia bacterium]|nr:hypothetical protein [Candidatus Binatia bacterium]
MKALLKRRLAAVVVEIRPAEAPQAPAMITGDEAGFFSDCTRRVAAADGAIVDLGCWMGGTAIALAKGLPQDRGTQFVRAYDRFIWEDWMPANTYCRYRPGESFLPEARRVVADRAGPAVELIQADLTQAQWTSGPIKLLLVDAMKSELLARSIAQAFFPHLRKGALVIHQDFKHFYTSWIHLLHYRLKEFFRPVHSVTHGGTVAFEVMDAIPKAAIDAATRFDGISDGDADRCFEYSLSLVPPAEQANVAAAHVMHYVHAGRKPQASERMDRYRGAGFVHRGEFPNVVPLLARL